MCSRDTHRVMMCGAGLSVGHVRSPSMMLTAHWPLDAVRVTSVMCLQYVETDLQRLQMKLKMEPRQMHEVIEAEYAAAARAKPVRRPPDLEKSRKPSHWQVPNFLV